MFTRLILTTLVLLVFAPSAAAIRGADVDETDIPIRCATSFVGYVAYCYLPSESCDPEDWSCAHKDNGSVGIYDNDQKLVAAACLGSYESGHRCFAVFLPSQ